MIEFHILWSRHFEVIIWSYNMAAVPMTLSLRDVLKLTRERSAKDGKADSKLTAEGFEDSLFNHLSLMSQNKNIATQFQDNQNIQGLRKNLITEVTNSNLNLVPKGVYVNAINRAFLRFESLLPLRQTLFAESTLQFNADRLSSRREQYLKHRKAVKEEELEELEKEWDKFFEDEDKPEAEYEELKKKLEKEEEEKLAEEQKYQHEDPNTGEKLVVGTFAIPVAAKMISENLSHNLLALNHTLQQSLQRLLPDATDATKGNKLGLEPNWEQFQTLNQNILNLENGMRNPNPDPSNQKDLNNQYNQVVNGFRQQYKTVQDNIPANNPGGQGVLDQWKLQIEQNLTQWFATGIVQKQDEANQNKLAKEWDAIVNPKPTETLRPTPTPTSTPTPATAAPTAAAIAVDAKNKAEQPASKPLHVLEQTATSLASAAVELLSPAGTSAAPSAETEPEERVKKSSPFEWPPKQHP